MGYQALLFCPDEKLARVVSQVFTELDFAVETVQEPFAAVKKLMSQRFDAIVVDCENEQNASLLFKSARNSSSNQSSLAIAVVEGQAGVAKAYRIGANLVLTKPINVEQAKGTLRVARGLLRKNSDAAAASTTGAAAAAPPSAVAAASAPSPMAPLSFASSSQSPSQPVSRTAAPLAFQANFETTELERPGLATSPNPSPVEGPAVAARANVEAKMQDEATSMLTSALTSAPTEQLSTTLEPAAHAAALTTTAAEMTTRESAPGTASPTKNVSIPFQSAGASTSGSGAATAPAKEIVAAPAQESTKESAAYVESRPATQPQNASSAPAPAAALNPIAAFPTAVIGDAPSFGSLGAEDNSGDSGSRNKILIAAGIVLALATLGYVGYTKLGADRTAAPSSQNLAQPAPAPSSNAAPNALATSSPLTAQSSTAQSTPAQSQTAQLTTAANRPGSTTISLGTQGPSGKTGAVASTDKFAAGAGGSPAIRIAVDPNASASPNSALSGKKPAATPILVKSTGSGTQAQSDDSAPALPDLSAAASTSQSSLSNLMSGTSASLPTPTLATVRISQGVSQGLVIKRVQPKYPAAALAVRAAGAVQIEATVNKEGTVTNIKILSGDPVLARAASDAVKQWRYKPYYLDGQPVEIQTQITVNFKAN